MTLLANMPVDVQSPVQGQPIGPALPDWTARQFPLRTTLAGQYCWLEPLLPEEHAESLYRAFSADKSGANWTYLSCGPFDCFEEFEQWLLQNCCQNDPLFFAIVNCLTGEAVGMASYMRIDPAMGVMEVGHIHFSACIQRTPLATEAMYLMMEYAFDGLGYRRYEWKCDALNERSQSAATRLGFTYEGRFRQAVVYKGRSRDTAWFSVINSEWPQLKNAFQCWLAPDNFNDKGQQRQSLRDWQL